MAIREYAIPLGGVKFEDIQKKANWSGIGATCSLSFDSTIGKKYFLEISYALRGSSSPVISGMSADDSGNIPCRAAGFHERGRMYYWHGTATDTTIKVVVPASDDEEVYVTGICIESR